MKEAMENPFVSFYGKHAISPVRQDISNLKIHLKRRGEDLRKYDFILLAQSTENYSGAEIEQIVVSGAARAISEGRELTQDDLYWEINHLIPLATTMQEQIKGIRSWARKRAISASKGRGIMDME